MAENRSQPRTAWLSGLGTRPWQQDEQAYATLLDALTRDLIEAEAVEREMVSSQHRAAQHGRGPGSQRARRPRRAE
jgi:hypothetical protein